MIIIINQNDFLADLQEYLNDQEAIALDINESNDYLINDKHQANYFVKLSKQCDEDINDIKKYVEEERARLNALLDDYMLDQVQAVERRKKFYDDALEAYIHRELDGTNKRSMKLPHGTIALKKQQPHYTYAEADIVEWAQDFYPDLVKTTIPEPKVSIDKKKLKDAGTIMDGLLYIDGVEVPGVQVELKDDAFSIK